MTEKPEIELIAHTEDTDLQWFADTANKWIRNHKGTISFEISNGTGEDNDGRFTIFLMPKEGTQNDMS